MSSDVKVPRLLRVREAAKLTGLERWRFYNLIKGGEGPPHLRIGQTIRIPEDGLVRWIQEQSQRRGEV
jgi:excisionase family DNA binding protein